MAILYNIKEMTGRRQHLTFLFVDIPSGDRYGPPEQDGVGPQQVDLLPHDDKGLSSATWRLEYQGGPVTLW
jgi:hypothetical protein